MKTRTRLKLFLGIAVLLGFALAAGTRAHADVECCIVIHTGQMPTADGGCIEYIAMDDQTNKKQRFLSHPCDGEDDYWADSGWHDYDVMPSPPDWPGKIRTTWCSSAGSVTASVDPGTGGTFNLSGALQVRFIPNGGATLTINATILQ